MENSQKHRIVVDSKAYFVTIVLSEYGSVQEMNLSGQSIVMNGYMVTEQVKHLYNLAATVSRLLTKEQIIHSDIEFLDIAVEDDGEYRFELSLEVSDKGSIMLYAMLCHSETKKLICEQNLALDCEISKVLDNFVKFTEMARNLLYSHRRIDFKRQFYYKQALQAENANLLKTALTKGSRFHRRMQDGLVYSRHRNHQYRMSTNSSEDAPIKEALRIVDAFITEYDGQHYLNIYYQNIPSENNRELQCSLAKKDAALLFTPYLIFSLDENQQLKIDDLVTFDVYVHVDGTIM